MDTARVGQAMGREVKKEKCRDGRKQMMERKI
jgi:hypothetical protein